jgi:hypothetical protein
LKKIVIGVLAIAALGAGGFYGWMQLVKAGILKYNKYDKRAEGALRVGGSVPDMRLALYDGGAVQLSSLWKRPVMLVFGSCT